MDRSDQLIFRLPLQAFKHICAFADDVLATEVGLLAVWNQLVQKVEALLHEDDVAIQFLSTVLMVVEQKRLSLLYEVLFE